MLGLVLLSLAVAATSAIVCPPNVCTTLRCAAITEDNCVGGRVVQKGGFCGCCDKCVMSLIEGDKCLSTPLMGVPPSSQCGEGLTCDANTSTCRRTSYDVQVNTDLTCAERVQQIQSAQNKGMPLLGQSIPTCEQDGSYAAKQCRGSVCTCVDPKGSTIPGYQANIGQAVDMNCQCARDKYAYMQTGLIGKMFYCTSSGNYRSYACSGSVCYCVDDLGAVKASSAIVNIGHIAQLQC